MKCICFSNKLCDLIDFPILRDGRVPESVKELLDNGKVDAADPNYNPNYGYEPYWPNGEWVYELPRDRDMNISTTKVPTVCGEECNYLYTK